jgi:hypothetical protein
MGTLIAILVFCQALGASIGAIMSIWSEFAYLRAIRDGRIDTAEQIHLGIIGKGLRFGMTLLLLSSLGLVIVSYASHSLTQPALTPAYWTLIAISLIIIGIAWALSRRHVSFAFGSATIFTAWWILAYLTLGWLSLLSFGSTIALLVVTTGVIYGVLHYIRTIARHSTTDQIPSLDKTKAI